MTKPDSSFLRLVFDEEEVYQIDTAGSAVPSSPVVKAESKEASAASTQEGKAVEAPTMAAEPKADYGTQPPILGNAAADVLVLVDAPDFDFIEPGDQAFLQDILKAIKLSFEGISLVNTARLKEEHFSYLQQMAYKKVILFGADKSGGKLISATQNPYIIGSHEGRKTLKAEELQSIRADRNKKVNLWNALKELFL